MIDEGKVVNVYNEEETAQGWVEDGKSMIVDGRAAA